MQERVELAGVDSPERARPVEQPLGDGVHREANRRLGGPLRVAGLQQVEPALLDRELDVLHVTVMRLQRPQRLAQLAVGARDQPGHLVEGLGVADARDHVLPLGVGEVVAGGLGHTGDLVAAESYARPGVRALVAKHHLLHVDGRSPSVGDPVQPPVLDRPPALPGVEHGADRVGELGPRILGEILAGLLAIDLLEAILQRAQLPGVEVGVQLHPGLAFRFGDRVLEAPPADAPDHVSEHLHQAPVRVAGEALVAGVGSEALDRAVIQSEVEDRVEHARH